jgi:hypothetical protein
VLRPVSLRQLEPALGRGDQSWLACRALDPLIITNDAKTDAFWIAFSHSAQAEVKIAPLAFGLIIENSNDRSKHFWVIGEMHVSVQWHIFQELKLVDVDTATRGERKRLKFGQMVFHPEILSKKKRSRT